MAKRDTPEDDYSFLPTVEDAQPLTKEQLWELAKAQKRKNAPPPPPPAPLTKEQLWQQTKQKRISIRQVGAATPETYDQPEPEPEYQYEPESEPEYHYEPEPEAELQAEAELLTDPEPEPTPPQAPSAESHPTAPSDLTDPSPEITTEPKEEDDDSEPHDTTDESAGVDDVKFIAPKVEDAAPPAPLTPRERLNVLWAMIGGRSLMLSIGLHLGLLLIAGFIVFTSVSETRIDFLPGGGTQQGEAASRELENTTKRKKMPWTKSMPMQRLAVANSSALQLPDSAMDLPMPDMSAMMDGKSSSFGFGKSGAGGGFGDGIGVGGKSGITFQPLSMFGRKLGGKKLAVILDVSSSMTPHLTRVVKEADKVALGSPIVCYFGCGLMRPERDERVLDRTESTRGASFERFWRLWHGPAPFSATPQELAAIRFNPRDPIPQQEVYELLRNRSGTYFTEYNGIVHAWTALLCDQIRTADTLYWFSDFMDEVDDKQIAIVLENLKRRKQKLFIHPSERGISLKRITDKLAIPSGGEMIEPLE